MSNFNRKFILETKVNASKNEQTITREPAGCFNSVGIGNFPGLLKDYGINAGQARTIKFKVPGVPGKGKTLLDNPPKANRKPPTLIVYHGKAKFSHSTYKFCTPRVVFNPPMLKFMAPPPFQLSLRRLTGTLRSLNLAVQGSRLCFRWFKLTHRAKIRARQEFPAGKNTGQARIPCQGGGTNFIKQLNKPVIYVKYVSMELSINIEYEQLLKLVKGLPYNQKKRLTREIEKDLKNRNKKSSKPNGNEELNEFQQFLLQGPLMSDEQYKDFKSLRKDFAKWIEK